MNSSSIVARRYLPKYPALAILLGTIARVPLLFAQPLPLTFGVIGEYGYASSPEYAVVEMMKTWNPQFIVTAGGNNFPDGAANSIDQNVGQYFHAFIAPYSGLFGDSAAVNHFWPCLGDVDWIAPGAQPYLDFFTLPGNERYYDVVEGPVHFFFLDSDSSEPDGVDAASAQAAWLHAALAAAHEPWRIVVCNNPPYSSGVVFGADSAMRWPFAQWGATAVISGREEFYERLDVDGFPYIVNGLGGRGEYPFAIPVAESRARFNADFGAMRGTATADSLVLEFLNSYGTVIDRIAFAPTPLAVREHSSPRIATLDARIAPQPVTSFASLTYHLADQSTVVISIDDLLGRTVRRIRAGNVPAGVHTVAIDCADLPAGPYGARIQAGAQEITRQFIVRH